MKRKQKILLGIIIFVAVISISVMVYIFAFKQHSFDTNISSLENNQEQSEEEKVDDETVTVEEENQPSENIPEVEEPQNANTDTAQENQEANNKKDSNQNQEESKTEITEDNSNSNSESDVPIESPDETPEKEEEPVEKTQEELNNEKRNQIMSTYNVTIKYGSEIGSYKPRGENPVLMTDSVRINSYLSRIEAALKVYPAGFFKEMKDAGMPVTFYLIERVPSNSFAGLTDKQYYSDIKITLTTTGFFERTLHHEIMHYIDYYLEIKLYPERHYESYQALNPSDFVYGANNNSYVFDSSNPISNYYFINTYAQQHVLEDRASLFEDLMARPYINSDCYSELSPLRKKAKLISEQIDRAYTSVSSSTYKHWERFIK